MIHIDFETRSAEDLVKRGLNNYAIHPTTDIICLAFGTSTEDTAVYAPDDVPQSFLDYVAKGGAIGAWNANFELNVWNNVGVRKYGWPELKISQTHDIMAWAAANNVPQALGDAASFLQTEDQKDLRGKYLINKLSKPNDEFGNFNLDSELLAEMFEYCKKDVLAEITIAKRLRPLSDAEQKVWELTQRINLAGVPVDPKELENALRAASKAKLAINARMGELTGGIKATERQKLLNWINENGFKIEDLKADTIQKRINGANGAIKEVLGLRLQGSQTSTAKYEKILDLQSEGRLRNGLTYHGASTGRYASRGVNLQNLPRPTLEDSDIEVASARIFGGGDGTMEELSSCIRAAIRAPEGSQFVDFDFSSVENRVGVWLAMQEDKLDLFRHGLDEYKTFASNGLYHVPYDEVTKEMRQRTKPVVLGCLFGLGPKGLKEYSASYGVEMTIKESEKAVEAYRADYDKVKTYWYDLNDAVIKAVSQPGVMVRSGFVQFKSGSGALWARLPSGRLICWQRPMVEELDSPWGKRLGVTVHTQNTYTREWTRNHLRGSLVFQNLVQAVARDLLVSAMTQIDEAGIEIVMCIHDEILAVSRNPEADSATMDRIMTTPPVWARGFPMAAEGWTARRYKK